MFYILTLVIDKSCLTNFVLTVPLAHLFNDHLNTFSSYFHYTQPYGVLLLYPYHF